MVPGALHSLGAVDVRFAVFRVATSEPAKHPTVTAVQIALAQFLDATITHTFATLGCNTEDYFMLMVRYLHW